jgi:hypothetical protein
MVKIGVAILDVIRKCELQYPRYALCTLMAPTATGASGASGETLIFGELEKSMKKAVEHLLNYASLDLLIKGGKRKVGGCAHDMKGGCEVVGSMREDKGASV